MLSEIEQLSRGITQEKANAFEQNRDEILRALRIEVALRHEGERGRIRTALADDIQVRRAADLLKNLRGYNRLLESR